MPPLVARGTVLFDFGVKLPICLDVYPAKGLEFELEAMPINPIMNGASGAWASTAFDQEGLYEPPR